jgi:peptide/nickel transport system permease protein
MMAASQGTIPLPAKARLRWVPRSFGGLVEAAAIGVLGLVALIAIVGPDIAPYSPTQQRFQDGTLLPPGSKAHLLGTDQLARDLLSRLLVGTRVSMALALSAIGAGLLIGALIGLATGYARGWLDSALMRTMDALLAFPMVVLALAIAAALGPGFRNTLIAISVVQVPGFARLVRAQTLRVMTQDYVRAAKAIGAKPVRVVGLHVIPNIWGPVVAQGVLALGSTIPAAATLSFLGLGVQPPSPDWGNMIADGYQALSRSPWVMLLPSLAIVLTVSAASIVADGLHRRLQ